MLDRLASFVAAGVIEPDNLRYWQRVQALLGSSLLGLWPMNDVTGTTALDQSGNARNGTYTNASLNTVVGPSGNLIARFPLGQSAYLNIFSAGLAAAWNNQEGYFGGWAKVDNVSQWSDVADEYLFRVFVNGNNMVFMRKQGGEVGIRPGMAAGGTWVQNTYTKMVSTTSWAHYMLTWSKSNDRLCFYWNGGLLGTLNGLGVWAGTPTSITIASQDNLAKFFPGQYDTWVFGNREATAAEVRSLVDKAPGLRVLRMAALGDSIVAGSPSWFETVVLSYGSTSNFYVNHAAGGAKIMPNAGNDLDTQTTASTGDDSDLILIAMGANDNNSGDMGALQAKYEANVVALQTSNPRARIVSLNVYPCWTDATGVTEQEKGNTRAAVAAAAAARGIQCVDMRTLLLAGGYAAPTHTTDGVHPNATGRALIASVVLANL